MGAEIHAWRGREAVVIDAGRIALLRRSLGDQRAREILEEAAFHLGDRLGQMAAARSAGDRAAARAMATRVAAIAEQVGLSSLAAAARGLGACLAASDLIAETAVASRLARLAEASFDTLTDYAERSAL